MPSVLHESYPRHPAPTINCKGHFAKNEPCPFSDSSLTKKVMYNLRGYDYLLCQIRKINAKIIRVFRPYHSFLFERA